MRTNGHVGEDVLDSLAEPIVVLDTSGTVLYANRSKLDYTGLSAEELRAPDAWERMFHPDDVERLREKRRDALAHGSPFELEKRARRSDGRYRWFLIRYQPMLDNCGKVVRWYGIGTDIDDRKHAETLRIAEKRSLEMIADGASLKAVLDHLCTSIDVQVSPSVTTILLMDPDGQRLWPSAGPKVPHEWSRAISPAPVAADMGLCSTAAFLKKRVIVPDVLTEPIWREEYREIALRNGIRSAWSEPILTKEGQVLGTFAIYCPEARVPTDADLALIEAAGRVALIAIQRQRSQEALRNALEKIQRSEARLRQVIDTIPTLAWCNLPDGPIEFLNKRWHEYTGLSPEESHGWGWQAAFHPDDAPAVIQKWQELLVSGEAGEIEARLRRHDGAFRWFLIRVEPLRDESGKLVRWYGTSTDIEALKQSEQQLREEERQLRQITDAIPQTIVVLDRSGAPIYANEATLDYTGLTKEDVFAPGFRKRIFHPDDLERLQEIRNAALQRGLPFEAELRALRKDGQYRWFLVRYHPFRNDQGQVVRWYATGTDIDDRVRTEERTRNENLALREQIDRDSMFEEIVGTSEPLRDIVAQISQVAPTDSTVLIQGETGTGKELIARAIHNRSKRANRAFIRVNCAAIPSSLIASELFGHEKGSFTGALQRRLGRFESADGGTIFLDEVGELPHETQLSLLRVLQEREFERVGGNQPIHVDVRVLAATNRDLNAAVSDGSFRNDLFYRLNVFPIQVPPLRNRADDIPLLVEYLVDRYAKKAGKRIRHISKETLKLLQSYPWPGNVRELQNVIERAVIVCDGETFRVDASWLSPTASSSKTGVPFHVDLAEREKTMIETALREARGLVSGSAGAAAKLGIPRQTLESKIKKLGISRYRFKS